MKYIVILGDGMADRPVPSLNNRTPLEVADKPNIDFLSQRSEVGLVQTVPLHLPAGSDVANLSVLGYDPEEYYSGRSPLEAASMRVSLSDTDTTFRANIVTLSDEKDYADKTMVSYSGSEITTPEAVKLIEHLKPYIDTEDLSLHAGVSYRHLLLHHDYNDNSPLTPPHDISGKKIREFLPQNEELMALMKKSYEVLKDYPGKANSLWLWGQGTKPKLASFNEKYGVKASVISAVDLIKGIGVCSGMNIIEVPGVTGDIDTNFDGKAEAAITALENGYNFVYLHIEAPDECGHRFETTNKIKAIEIIDSKIVKPIYEYLKECGEDYRILIMPDHATPLEIGTHAHDAVPYMIYDSRREMTGTNYTEKDAKDLFPEAGHKLMDWFLGR